MALQIAPLPKKEELGEAVPGGNTMSAYALFALEGAAFVRVQIVGESGGEPWRLVLDFGQFGRDER